MKLMSILFLLSMSPLAQAAPGSSQPAEENKVMEQLVEQIFKTIDKSAIDFNVNGITFESEGGKSKVITGGIELQGKVSFAGNWEVDLVNAKSSEKDNQAEKVIPKIQADAKNLVLDVDIKVLANSANLQVQFFSHFDKASSKWIPRPLTVKVANQMNKELLTIRLFSLKAVRRVISQNPMQSEISGTCESDKILLDFSTGRNRQVPVDCKFSGVLTEKGHKIRFQYMNK
jgi:hypothetical protein